MEFETSIHRLLMFHFKLMSAVLTKSQFHINKWRMHSHQNKSLVLCMFDLVGSNINNEHVRMISFTRLCRCTATSSWSGTSPSKRRRVQSRIPPLGR